MEQKKSQNGEKGYLKKSEGPNGTQYIKDLRVIEEENEDEIDEEQNFEHEEEQNANKLKREEKLTFLRSLYNIGQPFGKSLKVADLEETEPKNERSKFNKTPQVPQLNLNPFQMDMIQM